MNIHIHIYIYIYMHTDVHILTAGISNQKVLYGGKSNFMVCQLGHLPLECQYSRVMTIVTFVNMQALIPFKLSAKPVSICLLTFILLQWALQLFRTTVWNMVILLPLFCREEARVQQNPLPYGKSRKKRMAEQKGESRLSNSHIHTSGPCSSFLHFRS